jgi:hypothetical protein
LKVRFSLKPGPEGGWITPVIVVGFTIIWCLGIYFLIGNRPTDWNYGVIPDIPGQSFESTQILPSGPAPKQVELPLASRSLNSDK